jgi:hypothetical protein
MRDRNVTACPFCHQTLTIFFNPYKCHLFFKIKQQSLSAKEVLLTNLKKSNFPERSVAK